MVSAYYADDTTEDETESFFDRQKTADKTVSSVVRVASLRQRFRDPLPAGGDTRSDVARQT